MQHSISNNMKQQITNSMDINSCMANSMDTNSCMASSLGITCATLRAWMQAKAIGGHGRQAVGCLWLMGLAEHLARCWMSAGSQHWNCSNMAAAAEQQLHTQEHHQWQQQVAGERRH
eukprot:TRINITY_DN4424_c1_g1_i1.p2 TRINITY_DN4424_c1_g1~~TRINITY_DN4424_c1_g1_i1.p2  ORF type:complete len:117 (+),score=35.84 TRINITY_DN4424_c1_g1_i1:102-452(+)